MSNSLQPHGLYSTWNSPGQNTGVGSLSFPHEIFPTQGLNPGLPHCRQILHQLNHFALQLKVKQCKLAMKWSEVKVIQSWLFVTPQTIQSMGFSRPEYWSGYPFPSPGDLPSPGIEHRSPSLQMDSLPAEPQGKPKNTGVGILSLLQRIFLTQESNQGLLHCRQILYQLSHNGSPNLL